MELSKIKGIGEQTVKVLSKLGIKSVEGLIQYYPFRYDVIKRSNVGELFQDDKIIIDGMVETMPYVVHFNKKMDKMSFKINTGELLLNVVIFNRGFLRGKIPIGIEITLIGKYDLKHHTVVASDIRFGLLGGSESVEPIYHTTYGLTSKQLNKYIVGALSNKIDVIDYIPLELNEKYKFISKEEAIRSVHLSNDVDDIKRARLKLKYEELFLFMMKMNSLKIHKSEKTGIERTVDRKLVDKFIEKLPFRLTPDQLISINDIYDDLMSNRQMNRLLQGDVGSGKTIVSFISMYINYLGGYQSALMAPTEILAVQHFNNIQKLFSKYNINIRILTGKVRAKEKKEICKGLEDGTIDIIIGTHALISENVIYNNLGLVITDEQHRFGVNQRGNLKNKGTTPDILYMSATPIPRTYALTLYGDMDISSIKTMPSGRKEILTYVKKESDIKEVLEAMYSEIKCGRQVYVIAPLIEESDKIDLENVHALEEKMKKAFDKFCKIGVLHGKLSGNEKEKIMDEFARNETQILISTTVVEVGVDVKNATMMVIFDAFRFGLSALHQLRGRVGRNDLQSYCYLISNRETERLSILCKSNDGFEISEEDFRLRGSGDLFGYKQSGDMSFGIADIKRDFSMLLKAKEDSMEILKSKEYINGAGYIELKRLIENTTNLD